MMRCLYSRIATTFAVLMLAFGGVLGWLCLATVHVHQQELTQRLNRGIAAHIADHFRLLGPGGPDATAIEELFHMLMAVNPSIEVYLLDRSGTIEAHLAPEGHLKRDRVDLAPVHRFLAAPTTTDTLPIFGIDPRSDTDAKIFSAAALSRNGEVDGYLYVILAGEAYQQMATNLWEGRALRMAGTAAAGALGLTIAFGLLVFAAITRRLNALTGVVGRLERHGFVGKLDMPAHVTRGSDEIARLARAFRLMAERIADQFRELERQDQLRRELVANVCHDFRTPLTALHGYLETMKRKSQSLEPEERDRYLDVALRQSRKVGRLSQELFELANLECPGVEPRYETFSLAELIQDVVQKFELAAEERKIAVRAEIFDGRATVNADIGMIERVLVNLLDNALKHTPSGGEIRIEVHAGVDGIEVSVADTGIGIEAQHLSTLFERRSPLGRAGGRVTGGLGLLVVKRILALHATSIRAESVIGEGTVFRFEVPAPSLS